MTFNHIDIVSFAVETVEAAPEFFTELGFSLEGRMPIEGEWKWKQPSLCARRHFALELAFDSST